jgi:hypothetical protein
VRRLAAARTSSLSSSCEQARNRTAPLLARECARTEQPLLLAACCEVSAAGTTWPLASLQKPSGPVHARNLARGSLLSSSARLARRTACSPSGCCLEGRISRARRSWTRQWYRNSAHAERCQAPKGRARPCCGTRPRQPAKDGCKPEARMHPSRLPFRAQAACSTPIGSHIDSQLCHLRNPPDTSLTHAARRHHLRRSRRTLVIGRIVRSRHAAEARRSPLPPLRRGRRSQQSRCSLRRIGRHSHRRGSAHSRATRLAPQEAGARPDGTMARRLRQAWQIPRCQWHRHASRGLLDDGGHARWCRCVAAAAERRVEIGAKAL